MTMWDAMNMSILMQERWWSLGLQLSSCLAEGNMGCPIPPGGHQSSGWGPDALSALALPVLQARGNMWGQLTGVGLPSCSQRLRGIDPMVLSPSWLPGALEPKAMARLWDWGHLWWQRECFW